MRGRATEGLLTAFATDTVLPGGLGVLDLGAAGGGGAHRLLERGAHDGGGLVEVLEVRHASEAVERGGARLRAQAKVSAQAVPRRSSAVTIFEVFVVLGDSILDDREPVQRRPHVRLPETTPVMRVKEQGLGSHSECLISSRRRKPPDTGQTGNRIGECTDIDCPSREPEAIETCA